MNVILSVKSTDLTNLLLNHNKLLAASGAFPGIHTES